MAQPFIAEVKMWAGNFAPRGYAFCDGQLLQVAQHTALFALVGTLYGGDGRTTFGLPDLRARTPMHPGRGPGLTSRRLGESGGTEIETLTLGQMPSHRHRIQSFAGAEAANPTATRGLGQATMYAPPGAQVDMAPEAVLPAGSSQSHPNRQPYRTLTFIIALTGVFPSRS